MSRVRVCHLFLFSQALFFSTGSLEASSRPPKCALARCSFVGSQSVLSGFVGCDLGPRRSNLVCESHTPPGGEPLCSKRSPGSHGVVFLMRRTSVGLQCSTRRANVKVISFSRCGTMFARQEFKHPSWQCIAFGASAVRKLARWP